MPVTRLDRERLAKQAQKKTIRMYIYGEGLTLAKTAKRIGISDDTLARRLANPGSLTLDEINALVRVLHIKPCDVDDLRAAMIWE